jgi:hypothetical protein
MPDLEYALNIYPDEINCYKKTILLLPKCFQIAFIKKI